MKTQNMTGRTGRPVANQFKTEGSYRGQQGHFFQSYDSVIAFMPADGSTITMDRRFWNYSVTTSKYRNQFTGLSTGQTKQGIKEGSIILADLN